MSFTFGASGASPIIGTGLQVVSPPAGPATTSASGITPCGIADALAYFQYDIIQRLNRKFAMLQRLAQLLEELGNLSELVPNINALIPALGIDLSAYNQLAAACPFLNLPAPGEASLNALRSSVISAYSNLARNVLNHPWYRMGQLQTELVNFEAKISAPLGKAQSYLQCFQAACATVAQSVTMFKNVAQADVTKELATFSSNYVANAGQVLTEGAAIKAGEAKTAFTTLKNFGADAGTDYRTLRAQTPASLVKEPTVTRASGIEYANPPFVR